MTRDIEERLRLFVGAHDTPEPEVRRLALNWEQVQTYGPPPNPAKLSDSRAPGYVAEFGGSSWELDALEPTVIGDLIELEVRGVRDEEVWREQLAREDEGRTLLTLAVDEWEAVERFLRDRAGDGAVARGGA